MLFTLWIFTFYAEFTSCPQHITVYITLQSIFITSLSVQSCRQTEHLQILKCGNVHGCQLSPNKPEGLPLALPCVMHSSNSSVSSLKKLLHSSPLLVSLRNLITSYMLGRDFYPDTRSVPSQCTEAANPCRVKWVPALLTFDLLGLGRALVQLPSGFYERPTTCSFKTSGI